MLIPDPLAFEWDRGNREKNFLKHKVDVIESEETFNDPNNLIAEDSVHSETEKRFQLFGKTGKGRSLTIIFTIRKNKVRVISARDMNAKERRFYEEKNKIKANS